MPVLCRLGHIASSRRLIACGLSARQLRSAVTEGSVLRLRRGTYACSHLDAATARAAAVGGAVSCVSVLAEAGVWAGPWLGVQPPLHVQVPPTASGAVSSADLHLHWERPRFGMSTPWRASPMQALWQAMHCLDEEHAIAAMESAIHEGFVAETEVRRLGHLAPRPYRMASGA